MEAKSEYSFPAGMLRMMCVESNTSFRIIVLKAQKMEEAIDQSAADGCQDSHGDRLAASAYLITRKIIV